MSGPPRAAVETLSEVVHRQPVGSLPRSGEYPVQPRMTDPPTEERAAG
eukprot:gene4471-841_t